MTDDHDSASGDEVEPPSWPITDDAIRQAFESLLQDGGWGRYHGPYCDHLRDALAAFHNVEHVILCSSGTAAVELALRAVKVQPDDEVILAAYDYKANFANVLTLGATPVLADTLPKVPVLNPTEVSAAISDKTSAVICSHLHGSLACMDEVRAISAEHGVPVIEDACQATGGALRGRVLGSIGDIGVLSFGGSKLMTAGRGGAVLTNDAKLAQRIRLHTQRGNDAYPLSEMQAAVLLPQLKQLADRNAARLRNVNYILENWPVGAPLQPALFPESRSATDNRPAFYKVAFRYEPPPDGLSRESYSEAMRRRGVALDPGFAALHRIHSHRRFRAVGDLPNATALHESLMTLHHPVLLRSEGEIGRLIDAMCLP